jgi:hypothetical protein
MNTQSVYPTGQNDTRRDDALKEVRELARTHAAGDSALAVLAAKVLKWASEGVISSDPKNPKGDDIDAIMKSYRESYGKKAEDHYTKGGSRANKSKLRVPAKVGEMTTVDAIIEFDRFRDEYARQAKADAKLVKPEYTAIVEWGRMQLEHSDDPLSDEQIKEAVLKKATDDKTLPEFWEGIRKSIEKVISGEAGVKDQSDEAMAIYNSVQSYVTALMLSEKRQALLAQAAELGLHVQEDQEQEQAHEEQQAA